MLTCKLLDVLIDNLTLEEALEKVISFIESGEPHLVLTPNPEMLVNAIKDLKLKEILNQADLRLADGASLVVVSRILKRPLKERVTGIDLIERLFSLKPDFTVYLLGGKTGVLEKVIKRYPDLKVVGSHHGYFSDHEAKEIFREIKTLKPQILLVGLGSPRQEKWLATNYRELKVPFSMAVGGSFDVLAGMVKRAPLWIRRINLEWLYRLIKEPWRMKRQVNLIRFLWLIFIKKR